VGISNRKTTALAGARFRKAPTLDAANIVKTMAGGELIYPIASVNGQAANGSTLWFVCILDGPDAGDAPDTVGYVHSTAVVMPLAVVEAAGGHTDAELAAAVDAAEKAAADAVANSAVQKAATY
jgi:hypothetical protein